jgi:hypothetical protein
MAFSYLYDSESNIVYARATGKVDTNDLLKYVERILKDKKIKSGFIEVADLASIEDLSVHYNETLQFKKIWRKYIEKGCKATIIHAPTESSYGTVRMLQTVVDMNQDTDNPHFIVVRSKETLDSLLQELLGTPC